MGLFDSILGSSPKAQTTQQPLMTPEQQQALSAMIQQLMKGSLTSSGAVTPYTGELAAGTSNLQDLSLAAMEQQVMNQVGGGEGSTKPASRALTNILDTGGSPVDFNEAFTKGVQDPLLYDFSNKILPALQATFSGTAAYGTDKRKQQELLTKNLTDTLAGERSKLLYQTNTDALNRLLQAASGLAGVQTATTQNLATTLAGGMVPQATEQNALTAAYQEFLRQQQAKGQDVQQLLTALGLRPFENITTVTPGSQGLLGGLAQGAGAALAKYATGGSGFFGL